MVANRYKIKAFGVTKEIIGGREIVIEAGQTVGDLRKQLIAQFPPLAALRSLMIAVNHQYAEDNLVLQSHEEIALIPPVSGG